MNKMITTEMLFENNVKNIVSNITNHYHKTIQFDFDNEPDVYVDLLTWLEMHPEIVGKAFINYLINYGFVNDDIN